LISLQGRLWAYFDSKATRRAYGGFKQERIAKPFASCLKLLKRANLSVE
jgi:hypothetical protein